MLLDHLSVNLYRAISTQKLPLPVVLESKCDCIVRLNTRFHSKVTCDV
jgi:hypothetical protein